MSVTVIIGKNFGDEGKGLAIDYFASRSRNAGRSAVCVRHNGGAQAGHTVDLPDKRFVFSQLSSASFRGADTFWADSFLPDLYKLSEETDRFRRVSGRIPQIYASSACRCTYIGDILLNMLLETVRGKDRHGSCGMGINEAVVRSASFPLYLGEIAGLDASALYRKLLTLQREYLPLRLAELHMELSQAGEYGEMLQSETVLRNAAEIMARNVSAVQLREPACLMEYDDLLFEGAQGLLLDENYLKYAPHLTSSRTGLYEPARILRSLYGESIPVHETEIVYVTRSYVTRHGAGPLPYADCSISGSYGTDDRTNVPNPWQGTLRSAPHGDAAEFGVAVKADLAESRLSAPVSLFVTHLNESDGCLITKDGNISLEVYLQSDSLRGMFGRIYRSATPFSADVSFAE